ncbi:hypothetical protein [Paraburkholderia dipogonis]|uniref:hypothetical protein n=1 Tax=Paraburkholderia dipogonis TaxID=1211383 RepID=UPI0038BC06E3
MATKILRVTFRDGTRMYGEYSTVVDRADNDIAECMEGSCHADSSAGGDGDARVLALQPRPDEATFSCADDEIVQCEVLHYGDVSEFTAWVSTAKRLGNFGVITGATHGEEYRGDFAESAHTMNLQLKAAVAPPNHRQSRLRALLQRFV